MSVHASGDGSAAPGMSPRENTRQLEGEIAVLRDELTGLVAELDRRRHELTDFKLQARRHVLGVTLDRCESPRKRCRLCLAERLAEPSPESGDGPDRTPPGSGLAHGRPARPRGCRTRHSGKDPDGRSQRGGGHGDQESSGA